LASAQIYLDLSIEYSRRHLLPFNTWQHVQA